MEPSESPVLSRELILVDLEAATAEQAIRALAENMQANGYVKDTFVNAVLLRESIYPTGMPTEVPVGMPHTDVEHCLKPGIGLGILKTPVIFQTMGDPSQSVSVHLVFLLSVVNPASQVKLLHKLIDFFQQSAKINFLAKVRSRDVALATLLEGLDVKELEKPGCRKYAPHRAGSGFQFRSGCHPPFRTPRPACGQIRSNRQRLPLRNHHPQPGK